jgi:hypothetical protein
MKGATATELFPGLDQALMDRVELVGVGRDDAPLDRLLQPGPLKHRGLENRGRGVRVVFQQFRRAASVEAEVEPAVEAGFVAVPAFGNQRPERFRYFQPAQRILVVDRGGDEFEAHRVDFGRGRLDLAFDFIQGEGVAGAFVPIALAVDGMKTKAGLISGDAPVFALGAGEALHRRPLAAAVPMESMRSATEAAIGHAASLDQPPVRAAHRLQHESGTAVPAPRDESHRYRADGRGPHHGQDDTARAFHGVAPSGFPCRHSGMRDAMRQVKAEVISQRRVGIGALFVSTAIKTPPRRECIRPARGRPDFAFRDRILR